MGCRPGRGKPSRLPDNAMTCWVGLIQCCLPLPPQVMLAANLCMDPYLVNGSRGVVVGWADARRERWLLEREIEVLEATLCMLEVGQACCAVLSWLCCAMDGLRMRMKVCLGCIRECVPNSRL
mgnify:CR=1 FL=1